MIDDQNAIDAEFKRLIKKSPYCKIKDSDLKNLAVKLVLERHGNSRYERDKYQSIIEAILASPQIDEITKTLKKHSTTVIQKLLEVIKNEGRNPSPHFLQSHTFDAYFEEMLLEIYSAEHDLCFANIATIKERKRFYLEFQHLVNKMKFMLNQITDEDGQFPSELDDVMDKYDKKEFSVFKKSIDEEHLKKDPSYFCSHEQSEDQYILYLLGTTNFEERLQAYADGIVLWSKTKPSALRTGNPDVARLRLVRELTSYFRFRYGTPLRSTVCAIANSLHPGSDLGISDIAKLAP